MVGDKIMNFINYYSSQVFNLKGIINDIGPTVKSQISIGFQQ